MNILFIGNELSYRGTPRFHAFITDVPQHKISEMLDQVKNEFT